MTLHKTWLIRRVKVTVNARTRRSRLRLIVDAFGGEIVASRVMRRRLTHPIRSTP